MNTVQTTLSHALTNLRYTLCGPHACDPNELTVEGQLFAALLKAGAELQFEKDHLPVAIDLEGQRQLCTRLWVHAQTNPTLQVQPIELLYFGGHHRQVGLGHGLIIRQGQQIVYQRPPHQDPRLDAEPVNFDRLIARTKLTA